MGALRRVFVAVILTAVVAAGARAQNYSIFDISVAKHVDMANDGDAAGKYSAATSLLQANDGVCSDVACCVILNKAGATGNFGSASDGLDVITNQTELDAVFAVGSHATKVVLSAMNCCGVSGSILGCASTTSRNIVMVASADADVWAHEFGHTKGLQHNNACLQLIMHETALNTKAVMSSECDAFRANPDRVGGPCPGTASTVPSISFWGRLLLILLVGATATVLFGRMKLTQLASTDGSAPASTEPGLFDLSLFVMVMGVTLAAALALATIAVGSGARLAVQDWLGGSVSTLVLSYTVHLWILMRRT